MYSFSIRIPKDFLQMIPTEEDLETYLDSEFDAIEDELKGHFRALKEAQLPTNED